MEIILNDIEARVLGCLIEKEMTTPEYYPLSLNSLTNACNQKSNRDPVMSLEDDDVVKALDGLRFKQMVVVSSDGGRVPKYRHLLPEKLQLVPAELSILCELLVRGPQTVGELRTRSERMHSFSDLSAVEDILRELMEGESPFIVRLPKQPGRKEARYAHLLCGQPEILSEESSPAPEAARLRVMADNERISKLEGDVAFLRQEVDNLRELMNEFKRQFD